MWAAFYCSSKLQTNTLIIFHLEVWTIRSPSNVIAIGLTNTQHCAAILLSVNVFFNSLFSTVSCLPLPLLLIKELAKHFYFCVILTLQYLSFDFKINGRNESVPENRNYYKQKKDNSMTISWLNCLKTARVLGNGIFHVLPIQKTRHSMVTSLD